MNNGRNLVVISGYYGFGNLGDEAILEELLNELVRLVPTDDIIVLSQDPMSTQRTFGIRAISRWDLAKFLSILKQTRLFISGGGGLFQDSKTFKSTLFYASQISLAKAGGAKVLIYAQGIGPLRRKISLFFSRLAFSLADKITVRDQASKEFLDQFTIPCARTHDPVFSLQESALPTLLQETIADMRRSVAQGASLVGLSLRESFNFCHNNLEHLVCSLNDSLPQEAALLPLPLQVDKDRQLLDEFTKYWHKLDREVFSLNTSMIEKPSQWLSLISNLDMLISMRLHAAIMALISAVPVVGIAYDPKVTHLLTEFEQPILNLTNGTTKEEWTNTLQSAWAQRQTLASLAKAHAETAKNLACQNFVTLARILDVQGDVRIHG